MRTAGNFFIKISGRGVFLLKEIFRYLMKKMNFLFSMAENSGTIFVNVYQLGSANYAKIKNQGH